MNEQRKLHILVTLTYWMVCVVLGLALGAAFAIFK